MEPSRWAEPLRRLGDAFRYRLTSMAMLLTAALLAIGAVGFGVAGGFLWLSTQIPSHWAALVVGGGLLLIGAIIMALAMGRNGRQGAPAATRSAEADAQLIAERMIDSALGTVAESPLKAVFGAVALGMVVGLLREKRSP